MEEYFKSLIERWKAGELSVDEMLEQVDSPEAGSFQNYSYKDKSLEKELDGSSFLSSYPSRCSETKKEPSKLWSCADMLSPIQSTRSLYPKCIPGYKSEPKFDVPNNSNQTIKESSQLYLDKSSSQAKVLSHMDDIINKKRAKNDKENISPLNIPKTDGLKREETKSLNTKTNESIEYSIPTSMVNPILSTRNYNYYTEETRKDTELRSPRIQNQNGDRKNLQLSQGKMKSPRDMPFSEMSKINSREDSFQEIENENEIHNLLKSFDKEELYVYLKNKCPLSIDDLELEPQKSLPIPEKPPKQLKKSKPQKRTKRASSTSKGRKEKSQERPTSPEFENKIQGENQKEEQEITSNNKNKYDIGTNINKIEDGDDEDIIGFANKNFYERQIDYEKIKLKKMLKVLKETQPTLKPTITKKSEEILKEKKLCGFSERSEYFQLKKSKRSEDKEALASSKSKTKRVDPDEFYSKQLKALEEKESKLKKLRDEKALKEVEGITHKPKINKNYQVESRIGIGLETSEYVNQLKQKEEVKKQYQDLIQNRKQLQETIECTHRPQINDKPSYLNKKTTDKSPMSKRTERDYNQSYRSLHQKKLNGYSSVGSRPSILNYRRNSGNSVPSLFEDPSEREALETELFASTKRNLAVNQNNLDLSTKRANAPNIQDQEHENPEKENDSLLNEEQLYQSQKSSKNSGSMYPESSKSKIKSSYSKQADQDQRVEEIGLDHEISNNTFNFASHQNSIKKAFWDSPQSLLKAQERPLSIITPRAHEITFKLAFS